MTFQTNNYCFLAASWLKCDFQAIEASDTQLIRAGGAAFSCVHLDEVI